MCGTDFEDLNTNVLGSCRAERKEELWYMFVFEIGGSGV